MKAWMAAVFLVLAGMSVAVPAAAQPADEAAESGDRAEAFRAIEHGETEDVAGGPLLIGAYALVWLFVLGYVLRLARLQRSTERDLARLQQSVEQAVHQLPHHTS